MSDSLKENKLYVAAKYRRKMVRDNIKGSDSIKRANTIYLRMPTGFEIESSPDYASYSGGGNNSAQFVESDLPWYHKNAAYSSYLQRARFPEIVSLARTGLIGTAIVKMPEVELPNSINYLIENAGQSKESIYEIFVELIAEVLTAGNSALHVDVDPITNNLFINVLYAEDIIDWDISNAKDELSFVNIKRIVSERSESNIFEVKNCNKNYVYKLEDEGVIVRKYVEGIEIELSDEEGKKIEKVLSRQGIAFDRIPIFPVGSQSNSILPQPAPLSGLGEIALSIYRKDADLSNAQYMTCNPNLVISGAETGVDDNGNATGIPHIIGSQTALVLPDPDAKAYYLKTDTSALDHMRESIKDLFEESVMYSISLIGKGKKSAESADAINARQNASNATLVNIVKNCGKAIRNALEFCANNYSQSGVKFEPNLDFADMSLSPQMITSLTQIWMARGLSLNTLLEILRDAGLLPDKFDVDEELTKINEEPPTVA